MKRTLSVILAAVLLVSTVASGAALAQTQTPVDTPDEANETNTSTETADDAEENTTNDSANQSGVETAPGLQIAATIGAMSQDVEDSIDRYALGHRLQNANSSEEKQQIINDFVASQQEELNETDDNADENASTARKQYSQAMDVVKGQNAKQNAEFAQQMAEKHGVGVNKTKLDQLRNKASDMTGQQVSAIARSLAGPPAHANGNGAGVRGPPAHAGEDDNENDSDVEVNETVATEKLESAEAALADARNNSNVSNETLTEVEGDLAEARSLLEEARNLSETTENETETADNETEVEEERQELYEEVYEISVDSIEELEDDAGDAEEEADEAEDADDADDTETEEDGMPGNGNGNGSGN